VNRELALIKVETSNENRAEIMQIIEIFRAKVVDVSHNSLTVEISGSSEKVNALRDLLTRFGIKEIVRTGMIAIERGNKCI